MDMFHSNVTFQVDDTTTRLCFTLQNKKTRITLDGLNIQLGRKENHTILADMHFENRPSIYSILVENPTKPTFFEVVLNDKLDKNDIVVIDFFLFETDKIQETAIELEQPRIITFGKKRRILSTHYHCCNIISSESLQHLSRGKKRTVEGKIVSNDKYHMTTFKYIPI